MNLFVAGDFTLRSGTESRWKIECDALGPGDWAALAIMAVEVLVANGVPRFGRVVGVPRGGIPLALALAEHASGREEDGLLVAEDVVTTGGSIRRLVDSLPAERRLHGVAVFARGSGYPSWVHPIFVLGAR